MASTKISAMPQAATLTGAEEVPVVQTGANVKTTTQDIADLAAAVTPGGADTQVQFNDSGSFGGDAGFTYVKATDAATVLGSIDVGPNRLSDPDGFWGFGAVLNVGANDSTGKQNIQAFANNTQNGGYGVSFTGYVYEGTIGSPGQVTGGDNVETRYLLVPKADGTWQVAANEAFVVGFVNATQTNVYHTLSLYIDNASGTDPVTLQQQFSIDNSGNNNAGWSIGRAASRVAALVVDANGQFSMRADLSANDVASTIFRASELHAGQASTVTGAVKFAHASSANLTTFQAGNASAAVTYTWPTAAPAVTGYVLSSTTAGVLSWIAAGGAATLTVGSSAISGGTSGRILYDNAGVLGELASLPLNSQARTNTTETVDVDDVGLATTFSNASPVAISLDVSGLTAGDIFILLNIGAGLCTITPTSGTIGGAATYTIPQDQDVTLIWNGTNTLVLNGRPRGVLTGCSLAVGSITGLGTGVATALAVNVGSAGAFVTFNGALGTPSSGVITNCTGAPTLTSVSTTGENTLQAGSTVNWNVPTSDPSATGVICGSFNSGYTSSAVGDLVYLDSSATWQKADADAAATCSGMLGIALEVKASGAALKVLLQGMIYAATPFPTFTVGGPIYASGTAGAVTQTAPTATDSVTRVIGFAVHADKMYFNPSNDYITHT